ncbi:hypothetical protein L218DRAFT_1049982 [Marasmius fiardii PR-910]|nr:hypothetical protein L218DRAFT_1049982 [Marasmius fiardii PR-910]
MTTRLLNCRQAHWAMFLSEFDLKLDWAAGSTNIANAASRCPDFVPKLGDEQLTGQHQVILDHPQVERLYTQKSSHPDSSPIFAITIPTLDTSDLLQNFKDTYSTDDSWKEELTKGNVDFTTSHKLIFHKRRCCSCFRDFTYFSTFWQFMSNDNLLLL